MKLKGINPIEQHVEKIVLAGASAVTLLVVAMQFTTQPNMVQPDPKGGKLPPAKAFTPAVEQAQRLQAQLKPVSEPPLPEAPKLTLIQDFKAGSEKPLLESGAQVALGVPAKIGGGVIAPAADGKYAAIVVPAPKQPVAAVFEGALDPSTVVQYPELKAKELVPAAQPYDKASVSVEASFSGTELRAALETDPDGSEGELRPIPIQWWRDGVEIVGVQVERSRAEGGAWSEAEVVGSLPGRVDLLSELSGASRVTVSLLRGAVEIARTSPDSVQRPDYFPYLVGEEWIPPSDAVRRQALDERRVKIERIQESIQELNDRLAALETDLASAPVSLTSTPPATETGGGGGGGKGPGGGGRETSRPATTGTEPKRMTKAQIQRQIDSAKRDRDAKQAELVALGVEPPAADGATGAIPDSRTAIVPTLLETPSVKIWGHDITAARGETYRYRVRVVINNPAFGNALSLPEDQRAMAESPTLASAWTDWTEPVTLDPVRTYFVTNATVADAAGGMRASASVFEFYYGYWRVGNASLSPGDPIDAKLRLPAPDLMPIFDETRLAVAPAQRPGFGETQPSEGGGGGKGDMGPRTAAPETAGPAQAQLPANSEPGPKERSVSIDTVYLSTATMPVTPDAGPLGVAAGQKNQVYLRDGSGAVIARVPDVERASETFSRLERSAKLGERQGVPVPKVEKPKPAVRPTGPSERPPPGGGGGAGGG